MVLQEQTLKEFTNILKWKTFFQLKAMLPDWFPISIKTIKELKRLLLWLFERHQLDCIPKYEHECSECLAEWWICGKCFYWNI